MGNSLFAKPPVLDMRLEMSFVAPGAPPTEAEKKANQKLEKHADVAHRIGAVMDEIRGSFDKAYPGQTRTSFTNAEWRDKGFPHVADLNEILGRKGS